MFLSFLLSHLLHILSPSICMMCVCRILIKITYLLTYGLSRPDIKGHVTNVQLQHSLSVSATACQSRRHTLMSTIVQLCHKLTSLCVQARVVSRRSRDCPTVNDLLSWCNPALVHHSPSSPPHPVETTKTRQGRICWSLPLVYQCPLPTDVVTHTAVCMPVMAWSFCSITRWFRVSKYTTKIVINIEPTSSCL